MQAGFEDVDLGTIVRKRKTGRHRGQIQFGFSATRKGADHALGYVEAASHGRGLRLSRSHCRDR
jgi:hypothetical protein